MAALSIESRRTLPADVHHEARWPGRGRRALGHARRGGSGVLPVALLVSALVVPPAFAQEDEAAPRHSASVVVAASEEAVEVRAALVLELPPGGRTERLLAQFDLNRSGSLEEAEGRFLADALGPEAVGGFVLLVEDSAPAPKSVESSAVATPDGGIRVEILISYALEPDVERIGAKVLEEPGGGRVQARPIFLTMQLRQGDQPRGEALRVLKRPGEDASWVVPRDARREQPSEKEDGAEPRDQAPADQRD